MSNPLWCGGGGGRAGGVKEPVAPFFTCRVCPYTASILKIRTNVTFDNVKLKNWAKFFQNSRNPRSYIENPRPRKKGWIRKKGRRRRRKKKREKEEEEEEEEKSGGGGVRGLPTSSSSFVNRARAKVHELSPSPSLSFVLPRSFSLLPFLQIPGSLGLPTPPPPPPPPFLLFTLRKISGPHHHPSPAATYSLLQKFPGTLYPGLKGIFFFFFINR